MPWFFWLRAWIVSSQKHEAIEEKFLFAPVEFMNHRFVAVASHYHLLLLELLSNLTKQTNIVGCYLANSWWWSKHRGHPGFWEWGWQFCGDNSGNLKICHQSRLYRLNKTQKINNRQDFTFWKGGIDFFEKLKLRKSKKDSRKKSDLSTKPTPLLDPPLPRHVI